MDVNATMSDIRNLTESVNDILGSPLGVDELSTVLAEIAVDLAEKVSALDEWLSKGGFLPSDWERK